jgi:hypothetical protein
VTMLCHSHNVSVYRSCVRLCLFLTKIVVGVCLRACTGVRMNTSGMVRFVPGAPTSRANVNDAMDPHVRHCSLFLLLVTLEYFAVFLADFFLNLPNVSSVSPQSSSFQSTPRSSTNIDNELLRSDDGVRARSGSSTSSRGICPACKRDVLGNQDRIKVMASKDKEKVYPIGCSFFCRPYQLSTVESSLADRPPRSFCPSAPLSFFWHCWLSYPGRFGLDSHSLLCYPPLPPPSIPARLSRFFARAHAPQNGEASGGAYYHRSCFSASSANDKIVKGAVASHL